MTMNLRNLRSQGPRPRNVLPISCFNCETLSRLFVSPEHPPQVTQGESGTVSVAPDRLALLGQTWCYPERDCLEWRVGVM